MLKEKQLMKDVFEKQLLQSKLEIQEQTFNFISQEIHDNVGQILSFAKVQLNIMDLQQEMDKSILKEVKDSVSKAMTELRDIARSLSSEKSQSFNLLQSIEEEVNRINRSGILKATINVNGSGKLIKNQHKIILFRLIQESMQNILKHAKASELEVLIEDGKEQSIIMINDNGIGFDVKTELSKNSGLGLKSIINRAALIGGEATIQSTQSKGTAISIIIPYA